MTIRKMTIQVTFLYDPEMHSPYEWPLHVIGHEIDEGGCIGKIETVNDEPLTAEQVRQEEISMGGDGTFMVGEDDDDA